MIEVASCALRGMIETRNSWHAGRTYLGHVGYNDAQQGETLMDI